MNSMIRSMKSMVEEQRSMVEEQRQMRAYLRTIIAMLQHSMFQPCGITAPSELQAAKQAVPITAAFLPVPSPPSLPLISLVAPAAPAAKLWRRHQLLTESTLETAIQSKIQLQQASLSAPLRVKTSFSFHKMDAGLGSPPRKLGEGRICQDEDEESNMEAPCFCRGSLKRWCNEKGDISFPSPAPTPTRNAALSFPSPAIHSSHDNPLLQPPPPPLPLPQQRVIPPVATHQSAFKVSDPATAHTPITAGFLHHEGRNMTIDIIQNFRQFQNFSWFRVQHPFFHVLGLILFCPLIPVRKLEHEPPPDSATCSGFNPSLEDKAVSTAGLLISIGGSGSSTMEESEVLSITHEERRVVQIIKELALTWKCIYAVDVEDIIIMGVVVCSSYFP